MRTSITTVSIALALVAGAASASANFDSDQVVYIDAQMTGLYNNEEVKIVDGPNIPGKSYGHKLLICGN
ncbi:hypothetical protein [Amphritea sp.]|uniref:hypothetical protein n=1 Tax=Amphritea sp. TaxID=1872502 RepID=UPI003A8E6FFF